MLRLGTLLKRTLGPAARCAVPVALCAVALAACGSQPKQPKATTTNAAANPPSKRNDHVVYIYSSLPLRGPERSKSLQVEKGIEFALERAGNKAGSYHIRYNAGQRLDDTTKPAKHRRRRRTAAKRTSSKQTSTGWDATQTWKNAQKAAGNPQTVAYVGDLDSGATELSVPILNQAGIVQLSPGSGYPGLTDSYNSKYKITQANEPDKYYPQSQHTLLRMIPSDIVQAAAVLKVLSGTGCTRFAAWKFGGTPEATALFNAVVATAAKNPKYKLTYYKPPPPPLRSSAKDYGNYLSQLGTYVSALSHAPGNVRCAVLVGHVTPAAVSLTFQLHEQLSIGAPIVGTSGFCSSRWLQEMSKADAKVVAPVLYCTTPALPVTAYSGGGHFQRLFEGAYHLKPSAYDYYGYVAAKLVITAVGDVVPREDPRFEVTNSLVGDIASGQLELYDYYFDHGGDLQSFATYGVDNFVDGSPKPYKTVTPRPLLLSAG